MCHFKGGESKDTLTVTRPTFFRGQDLTSS